MRKTSHDVENNQIDQTNHIHCENCQEKEKELEVLKEHNENMKNENIFLKSSIAELQSKIQDATYSYEHISKDKKSFKQSTGLEVDAFEHLYELVRPGENWENVNSYQNKTSTTQDESFSHTTPNNSKKK